MQWAGFSNVKSIQRQVGLQYAGRGVRENGQIGKTVWKINLKRKDTAAISKVNPSLLKHIQIKLMVFKSVYKNRNILTSKEGVVKDTLFLFLGRIQKNVQFIHLQFTIYELQFARSQPFVTYRFLFRRTEKGAIMKLIPPCHEWNIPIFRESLRHKDAHRRFRFFWKVKKINKISFVHIFIITDIYNLHD